MIAIIGLVTGGAVLYLSLDRRMAMSPFMRCAGVVCGIAAFMAGVIELTKVIA